MDGCSLHFTVHPSISLSAKIHLDIMIEEGAQRNSRPKLLALKIKCGTVGNTEAKHSVLQPVNVFRSVFKSRLKKVFFFFWFNFLFAQFPFTKILKSVLVFN